MIWRNTLTTLLPLLGLFACKGESTEQAGSAAPAQITAAASGSDRPLTLKEQEALAPAGKTPYRGPWGTVEGVVRMTGDEAPVLHEVQKQIPASPKCDLARTAYERLFREGAGRATADVLVSATNYPIGEQEVVVPIQANIPVETNGCAFNTRTIVMTPKQHVVVRNVGTDNAMPSIAGAPSIAVMLALPGGEVKLPVPRPGRFGLVDKTNDFSFANVFVVPYATAAVTGTDGRFRIERVPVGAAEINAYLPIIGAQQKKSVEVRQGQTVSVEFELNFDLKAYAQNQAEPETSAGGAGGSAGAGGSGAGGSAVAGAPSPPTP